MVGRMVMGRIQAWRNLFKRDLSKREFFKRDLFMRYLCKRDKRKRDVCQRDLCRRFLQEKLVQQSLESNTTEMTETSGNVMGISQYNKRENMAQLGNMVRPGKSQNQLKSSLPDAMKPVLSAEETTELSDVITREPKDVRMS